MDVVAALNEKLLNQPFDENRNQSLLLEEYGKIAYNYSKMENAIAVLSDMKSDKSYIYNGGIAESLGIAERGSTKEISSIWEEDIFSRIHPDDLMDKHMLELHFFHFLKSIPVEKRSDYYASGRMRICNKSGEYFNILHRIFYLNNCLSGSLWLCLCLYNFLYEESQQEQVGLIVNSSTGEIIKVNIEKSTKILTIREIEILQLIEKGKLSKEIADMLFISKNTVNRHRQNILEKLRVKNSFEACRIAKAMKLL